MIQDLDVSILKIVNDSGFIRRKKLYEEIKKTKEDINNITFNRHIKSLLKLKEIKIFKYPEYEKLGLFSQDKRASYIASSKITKDIEHYNNVFELLKSKDSMKKKNALVEIESMMNNIILTPAQLTILVNLLNKENYKLCENVIRIIYQNINNKKIFPSDLKKFQKEIIEFLEKHNRKEIANNIKAHIIHILGLLKNMSVLNLLKKEIKDYHKDFETLEKLGYTSWSLAKIIEDVKKDLFDFQNSLKDENDSQTVFKIRRKAQENLDYYTQIYPKFKEKLDELKK